MGGGAIGDRYPAAASADGKKIERLNHEFPWDGGSHKEAIVVA
jgi:hypothetical protein